MTVDKQFPQFAELVYLGSQEGLTHFNFMHDMEQYAILPAEDCDVVSICGSLGIFHVLVTHIDRPRRLVLVDVNPVQLAWTEAVIKLIKKSADRDEYFKRLYCRDFGSDLYDLVKTDPDPGFEIDDSFAAVPELALKLKRATPAVDREALSLNYSRSPGWLASDKEFKEWGQEDWAVYHLVADWGNHPPQNGYEFIFKNWGWHSPEGFAKLQGILNETPTTIAEQSIFEVPLEGKTFIYLSNAFAAEEEIFLAWVKERFEEIASGELLVRGCRFYMKYGDVWYPEGRLWFQRLSHTFPPMNREQAKGVYKWGKEIEPGGTGEP